MARGLAPVPVQLNATLSLNNTLQPGANFSSGMAALGEYIHSKGCAPSAEILHCVPGLFARARLLLSDSGGRPAA